MVIYIYLKLYEYKHRNKTLISLYIDIEFIFYDMTFWYFVSIAFIRMLHFYDN